MCLRYTVLMQAFTEPKYKYTSRVWRPIRLWEALYRVPHGERLLLLCKQAEIGLLSLQIQEFARLLKITVACNPVKMIYEDDQSNDLVADVLVISVINPRAEEFADEDVATPNWYPIRLGEAVYRNEDGKSLLWECDADNDSSRLLRHAKAVSSRLGIKVACKIGRMIDQRDGVDIVRRLIIMTPFGNEKAIEYARAVASGEASEAEGAPITQDVAESFFNPKVGEPPKKRGRPSKKHDS